MRNLFDAYAKAAQTWAANVASSAITRSTDALEKMEKGTYSTEEIMKDVWAYWRDLADFRAEAAIGVFPTASMTITAWKGAFSSNVVQAPASEAAQFALTPVVNPASGNTLEGLSLSHDGSNSLRVTWGKPGSGLEPTDPKDRNGGLFQGAIYWRTADENVPDELIAPVYVQLLLPEPLDPDD